MKNSDIQELESILYAIIQKIQEKANEDGSEKLMPLWGGLPVLAKDAREGLGDKK